MLRSGAAAACLLAVLSLLPMQARPDSITVQEGDTLEQLALQHGVALEVLIEFNGISDPTLLQVGQVLRLPGSHAGSAVEAAPAPDRNGSGGEAALLLSPAERRDRAVLELREQSGQARWKWFNNTAVDWSGWKLHAGGVRITLVKPSASDLGLRGSTATAVAVQCETLRQNWRIDGQWQGWQTPFPDSVGQRIVLDLCSNTLDGSSLAVPPPP